MNLPPSKPTQGLHKPPRTWKTRTQKSICLDCVCDCVTLDQLIQNDIQFHYNFLKKKIMINLTKRKRREDEEINN